MMKSYNLIGSEEKIGIDIVKNLIKVNKMQTQIAKRDKNICYLSSDNKDFQAAVLAFNDSGLFWEIDKPTLDQHNDLSGCAVYKLPKHKTLFFKVPKNACSSVVSELYNRFYRTPFQKKCSTSDWIFRDILVNCKDRSRFEIIKQEYISQKEEYKDWEKFIIYDDPIRRFLRLANHKYMKNINFASIVKPQENISRYLDELILTVQADNLNRVFHDTHLTSITNIWGEELDDMTYIVNLKDLDEFLRKKLNIKAKRYLVTKGEKPIKATDLTDEQIGLLKDIFAADYEIPEKYKDKFYKGE